MRRERLAGINNLRSRAAREFNVPEIAFVFLKEGQAGGGEDVTCGLHLRALGRVRRQFPAQARSRLIDADGINEVLAAELRRYKWRCRCHGLCRELARGEKRGESGNTGDRKQL